MRCWIRKTLAPQMRLTTSCAAKRFSLEGSVFMRNILESRIRAKGIDASSPGIKEYLDLFKSASIPPHGGGGIGLDRVVAWFLGLPTIHLASYPRTPKMMVP